MRWDADTDNPITHGEWVSAEEYDAIAAELAEAKKVQWRADRERIDTLEAALRKIVTDGDYTAPEGMKRIAREALGLTAETPEQMHARVVTETADAIAKERGLTAETEGKST